MFCAASLVCSSSSCCFHGCCTRTGAGEGQRCCKEGGRKASPSGGQHPDADSLGTAVIRLFCGHRDIYTKAGEKYNENYTGGCSTSRSKNESISGMEALSIHLYKMNHMVGTHQKQVEDCEVDVKGFGFSTRTEFPRVTDSIVLFGTCECDFWGHDVIHPLSS